MTPDYRITADGQDITSTIQGLLESLEITDQAGIASDTLTMVLDDRANIAMPRTGAELSVSLGYRESGLISRGRWVVNEIGISAQPQKMTIRARAANMASAATRAGIPNTLRSHKTRSWEHISLGGIARTIAAEHGLQAAIDPLYDSGSPPAVGAAIQFVAQMHESDMHLLTRLAADAGATFRVVEGRLLLTPAATSNSISGTALEPLIITPDMLSIYHITITDRSHYAAAIAYWHDTASASRQSVRAGAASGDPVLHITGTYPTEQAALAAANTRLSSATRGRIKLTLTMPGLPIARAGIPLQLHGFRPGIDGQYSITKTTSTLRSDFTTKITAETA